MTFRLTLGILLVGLLPSLSMAQISTQLEYIGIVGDVQANSPADNSYNPHYNNRHFYDFKYDLISVSQIDFFLGDHGPGHIDAYASTLRLSFDSYAQTPAAITHASDIIYDFSGNPDRQALIDGIPHHVNVDALDWDLSLNTYVFSVDTLVELDGTLYQPDDLIVWHSNGTFSLYFDGQSQSNIDALAILENGKLLLSVDTFQQFGGTTVGPTTVFEINQNQAGLNAGVVPSFDPKTYDPSWHGSNVVGIIAEPYFDSGTVQWSSAQYEALENQGSVSVRIVRVDGGDDGPVLVGWEVVHDTTNDSDFLGTLSGAVTFQAGENSKTIVIPIHNDALNEVNEQFTLRFVGITARTPIGTPSEATVTILEGFEVVFKDSFESL